MSSLFRKHYRTAAAVATAGTVLVSTQAGAVEFYYQPIVQVSTAYNTNVDLQTSKVRDDNGNIVKGNVQGAEGYYADAATVIGIATPNSETSLTPRLLYNYYPTIDGLNRLEGFLTLNNRENFGQRDRFNISGFFDHRDDTNAEQPGATEPVTTDPGNGTTTPSSGRVATHTVRNWLILDPTFTHLLTPLSAVGVGGEYQRLDYSPDDTGGHIPFNYYMGKVFYSWTQNQRMDYTVSAFGSRYEAGTIDARDTSEGVNGSMKYSWTQVLQSNVSASFQRSHYQETDPRVYDRSSNQWAASFSTTYNGVASRYRASIGRSIIPGANGGLYVTDQLQAQYDRDFTARLTGTAAVRWFRDRTVDTPASNDTRNYVTPYVRVQYMLSPRFFVAANYNYIYQKYRSDPAAANANRVAVSFGYKGLERQTH